MSKQKKTLGIVGFFAVVAVLVILTGRYGWRLAGFSACGGSAIDSVVVSEGAVELSGCSAALVPAGCVGWIARQEGDTLYFGVRYDAVFGIFETGSFHAVVPTKGTVTQVILRAGDKEYPLWPKEG